MKQFLFYAAAVFSVMMVYWSPSVAAPAGSPCPLNENATLSVTLNDTQADVGTIKDRLDKEISDIAKAAKEEGVDKFYAVSNNYNVGPQKVSQNKQYHLEGNITFKVEPSAKALTLMAALTKKGYFARANMISFNNGSNCNSSALLPAPPVPANR